MSPTAGKRTTPAVRTSTHTVGTPSGNGGSDLVNFAFFQPAARAANSRRFHQFQRKMARASSTSIRMLALSLHRRSPLGSSPNSPECRGVSYSPYSDFALHKMGKGIGPTAFFQGAAGPPRLPHSASLGPWAKTVLPARWAHQRSDPGNPVSPEHWIRSK